MGKLALMFHRILVFLCFVPLAACTVDLAAGNFHFSVDPTTGIEPIPSEPVAG
jgi:hypothetical protein